MTLYMLASKVHDPARCIQKQICLCRTHGQAGARMQELAVLDVIERALVHMLARCFQSYHALSDSTLSGILTSDAATTESPAPILHHALKLAGMLLAEIREVCNPSSYAKPSSWQVCFLSGECESFCTVMQDKMLCTASS